MSKGKALTRKQWKGIALLAIPFLLVFAIGIAGAFGMLPECKAGNAQAQEVSSARVMN